jgi:ADP-ribose pyrophosphatase YjhB (NUDIX family)
VRSEETGLNIQIDRLLDVFPGWTTAALPIIIAYAASVVDGELQERDDAEEAGWFTANSLPELVFASTGILIGRWIDSRREQRP